MGPLGRVREPGGPTCDAPAREAAFDRAATSAIPIERAPESSGPCARRDTSGRHDLLSGRPSARTPSAGQSQALEGGKVRGGVACGQAIQRLLRRR